jgi:hypothetical protein
LTFDPTRRFTVLIVQTAAVQLSGDPPDGPCGDDRACLAEVDEPPIACTLDGAAVPDRLAEWRALLEQARSHTYAPDGALRIEFNDSVALGELTRLAVAEQHCCAFFSFTITIDPRGIALEVRAPDGAADVVAALFG